LISVRGEENRYFNADEIEQSADFRVLPFMAWVVGAAFGFIVQNTSARLTNITALDTIIVAGVTYIIIMLAAKKKIAIKHSIITARPDFIQIHGTFIGLRGKGVLCKTRRKHPIWCPFNLPGGKKSSGNGSFQSYPGIPFIFWKGSLIGIGYPSFLHIIPITDVPESSIGLRLKIGHLGCIFAESYG